MMTPSQAKTFVGDTGQVFTIISEPSHANDFLTYKGADGTIFKERNEAVPVKFKVATAMYTVSADGKLNGPHVGVGVKDEWDREEKAEQAKLRNEGYRTALVHVAIALILLWITYIVFFRMMNK